MAVIDVTTWHLEMTDPGQLRPAYDSGSPIEYRQAKLCNPAFGLFLNNAVGADYNWKMRTKWNEGEWRAFWDRPELEVWVAYVEGTPIGFFELESDGAGNTEFVKFGIMSGFTGKGFGGRMLTRAVQRAWEQGAKRVWLHTCSLDHPVARQNYESRGFVLFKTETDKREM